MTSTAHLPTIARNGVRTQGFSADSGHDESWRQMAPLLLASETTAGTATSNTKTAPTTTGNVMGGLRLTNGLAMLPARPPSEIQLHMDDSSNFSVVLAWVSAQAWVQAAAESARGSAAESVRAAGRVSGSAPEGSARARRASTRAPYAPARGAQRGALPRRRAAASTRCGCGPSLVLTGLRSRLGSHACRYCEQRAKRTRARGSDFVALHARIRSGALRAKPLDRRAGNARRRQFCATLGA